MIPKRTDIENPQARPLQGLAHDSVQVHAPWAGLLLSDAVAQKCLCAAELPG